MYQLLGSVLCTSCKVLCCVPVVRFCFVYQLLGSVFVPVVKFSSWCVLCRCCCLLVVIHMHNSIKLTKPIGDVLFLFSNIQFSVFVIQSSNSRVLVSWARLSFHQLTLHVFSPDRLERGLISSLTRILFFWIPRTVTWPIQSNSITKFGRPEAMIPVPIVFLLIHS